MTKLSIFVLLCVYLLGQWPTSVKSVSSSLMQSLPQRRINRHFNGDIFVEQGKVFLNIDIKTFTYLTYLITSKLLSLIKKQFMCFFKFVEIFRFKILFIII